MRWGARGRRACALRAALLAGAAALAIPHAVSAAPAVNAAATCGAGAPPAACALLRHLPKPHVPKAHNLKHRTTPPPPAPAAPPPPALLAGPLLQATFVTNSEIVPVARSVAATAPATTQRSGLGHGAGGVASAPRLGGILAVPQPNLLGPATSATEAGTQPDTWQLVALAEGVALLALLAAMVRRRRTSGVRLR